MHLNCRRACRYVKKPSKPAQKLHNITLVFNHLQQTEGVSLLGIGEHDMEVVCIIYCVDSS